MTTSVHAFSESMGPATDLAARLRVECCAVARHLFPDGESLVQVKPRSGTAILYRSLDHPNEKLVELLLAASALRHNGVRRVILVAPYLAYMRQDIAFEPGQAVSQKVIGALLARHFDALLTVDPHLHRIKSLAEVMPGIEAISVSAAPALGRFIADVNKVLLAGPDAESRQWVEAIAASRGLDVIVGEKRRLGDRDVEIVFDDINKVAGRSVILVDDVISSGRTLEVAARCLVEGGAASVQALATHCLASQEDLDRLAAAGISLTSSTDSIAGPTAAIPLASVLAEAITGQGWLQ